MQTRMTAGMLQDFSIRSTFRAAVCALSVITALAATPALAAPAGMVADLAGKPELRAKGAGPWTPLVLRQKVEAGDVVRCGAGAQATVVLFSSGERFQIASGKEATVDAGTVRGGQSIGALKGPSAKVAMALGGAPTGAVRARPAPSHRRLMAKGPCWLVEGERKLQWDPETGAAAYLITLYDQADNAVWSQRVTDTSAELPAEASPFGFRRPYLWRLTLFGKSGKPAGSRWGVITFLSAADAEKLTADEKELLEAIKATPEDTTSKLLLADLYQSYGVMERTLEVLDDLRPGGRPGIAEALEEAHRQISPLALLLYTQSQAAPE